MLKNKKGISYRDFIDVVGVPPSREMRSLYKFYLPQYENGYLSLEAMAESARKDIIFENDIEDTHVDGSLLLETMLEDSIRFYGKKQNNIKNKISSLRRELRRTQYENFGKTKAAFELRDAIQVEKKKLKQCKRAKNNFKHVLSIYETE